MLLWFFGVLALAITAVTAVGTAGVDTGAGNPTATVTATVEADHALLVLIAKDNVATADGTGSEITGVTSSPSNDFVSVGRFVNAQGAANAGAYVEAFLCKRITNALTSGVGTVTVAKSTDVDCAVALLEATITGGNILQLAGSVQTLANDAADPGSQAISGLTSKEYLFVRAIAAESETATGPTATASHTAITGAISSTAGGSATNMRVAGEFIVLTGTGDTSDPTLFAADCASIFFALEETTPPAGVGALLSDRRSRLVDGGLVI